MSGRLAFVTPRFGPGVVGGSEAVMREIALGLAGRGWQVEVLTTTATNHHTWASDLAEGTTVEEGVTVRRFETVRCDTRVGVRTHVHVYHGLPTSVDEQLTWLNFPFRVPGLFAHLLAHGDRYDAVVFSPYLFWTTTVCLPLVADRAVVMPCLHDEVYAHMDVIRPVLADPAVVWFLSEPEHDLAHRLGPVASAHTVTGAGVDPPGPVDASVFRATVPALGGRPYVVFTGRRERDKGWDWLLECYADSLEVADHGVDLVAAGSGEVSIPRPLRGRVHDVGFVSTEMRDSAMAGATAVVQPSLVESFSRLVMEAWLVGTPVLVRAGSEVVEWHCERSGGGMPFAGGADLAARLGQLVADPAATAAMGEAGRRYVVETYQWPVVLDRMEASLRQLGRSAG